MSSPADLLDANSAEAHLLRFLAIDGVTGEEQAIADAVIDELVKVARTPAAGAPAARGEAADFRVFYLRYAWAQDTTMQIGGRQIVLPGVASILRSLVGVRASAPLGSETLLRPTQPSLKGQGLAGAARDRRLDVGALRHRRILDQHSGLIVVADGKDFRRHSNADGVPLTEIVIDDDAHDIPPLVGGETASWRPRGQPSTRRSAGSATRVVAPALA